MYITLVYLVQVQRGGQHLSGFLDAAGFKSERVSCLLSQTDQSIGYTASYHGNLWSCKSVVQESVCLHNQFPNRHNYSPRSLIILAFTLVGEDDIYLWKSSMMMQASFSLCQGPTSLRCRLSSSSCRAEGVEGYLEGSTYTPVIIGGIIKVQLRQLPRTWR